MGNFSNANAVALNWKVYGSSKRAFKTTLATYEAFTYHCDESLDDCALIKSFIKPAEYTYNYRNPHRFYMNDEKYVDALGNTFEWMNSAKNTVAWCTYKSLYLSLNGTLYPAIKRRIGADMDNSTDNWQHFNRNNIYTSQNQKI